MAPKSAMDIDGLEYDWLGCDGDGNVAFFSTAGGGYAPVDFLRDTDAHRDAIDAILALPAITRACRAPQLLPQCVNTWQLMAERGIFAFDSDANGIPYQLVAVPDAPITLADLPNVAANVVQRVTFAGLRFPGLEEIPSELLDSGVLAK